MTLPKTLFLYLRQSTPDETATGLKKAFLTKNFLKISGKTIGALKKSLILFSFFGSLSVFANGLCLSPIEMAALFSKKGGDGASYKSKIRKRNKGISNIEKQIEKIEENIEKKREKAAEVLSNFTGTLNSDKLRKHHTDYLQYNEENYSDPIGLIENYVSERSDSFAGCPNQKNKREAKCYDWQLNKEGNRKNPLFKAKGKIKPGFCDDRAHNAGECKEQLKDTMKAYDNLEKYEKKWRDKIADLEKKIEEYENDIETFEDEKLEAEFGDGEEDETEASGLCLQCLKEVRRATGPSGWQRLGSGLTAALGVGLSVFGIREARRAQRSTNELLALQGFPAENNFGYNLAGASLGYPLVAQGLYGLSRGGMSRGGYGCSSTASPYGSMNPMMQQMQYQAMGGGMNPFGGGVFGNGINPMMQAQFQSMNPFGGMNPMMQMQFQSMNPFSGGMNPFGGGVFGNGINPMMQAQFQSMNPFGGMNPMMQMQFQSMNPFGGGTNPFGGGNWGGINTNPWGGGGNNWAMQQMQMQMQMRMQMQQAWMAKQQAAAQDWMQRQQVIGHLSQQLMQIQSQIQMVMSGGTTGIPGVSGTGGLTPGGTSIGGPTHTPVTTPSPTGTQGSDPPIQWR